MPKPQEGVTPRVPDAAVEALAKRRYSQNAERMQYEPNWDGEKEAHRQVWRDRARPDLEAAYPHLLAAFKEELLSKEAVEEAAREVFKHFHASQGDPAWSRLAGYLKDEYRQEARFALEAALASLENDEGAEPTPKASGDWPAEDWKRLETGEIQCRRCGQAVAAGDEVPAFKADIEQSLKEHHELNCPATHPGGQR